MNFPTRKQHKSNKGGQAITGGAKNEMSGHSWMRRETKCLMSNLIKVNIKREAAGVKTFTITGGIHFSNRCILNVGYKLDSVGKYIHPNKYVEKQMQLLPYRK